MVLHSLRDFCIHQAIEKGLSTMPSPRTRRRHDQPQEVDEAAEIVKNESRVNRHAEGSTSQKTMPLRSSSRSMNQRDQGHSSDEAYELEESAKSNHGSRKSSGKRGNEHESSTRSSLQDSSTLTIKQRGSGTDAQKGQRNSRGSHRDRRRDSSRSQRSAATEESAQYLSGDEENDLSLQLDRDDQGIARRKKPRHTRSSQSSQQQRNMKQEPQEGEEEEHGGEHSPHVLVQPSKGDPNKSPSEWVERMNSYFDTIDDEPLECL
eukprot:gb/GECG01015217.1/.p1 GENE.gb/GECG01015217.1/~~gb/GECG01015217.1/.p1  ORF type:complete len:263 (+),score=43.98 gb/GECG01015217.1/:1-789(+)